MRNYISAVLTVLILATLIDTTVANATWTTTTSLSQVRPSSANNGIFVIPSSSIINPESCSNASFYMISTSSPVYKELFAVALTSLAADMSVLIWVNGCVTSGAHTFPKIDDIILIK